MSLCHFRESYSGGELLVVLLDAVRPRPVEGLRLDKVDPLVRRRGVAVDAQGAAEDGGNLGKSCLISWFMILDISKILI